MPTVRKQLEHLFAIQMAVILLPVLTFAASIVLQWLRTDWGLRRQGLAVICFGMYQLAIILGPTTGLAVLGLLAVRRNTLVRHLQSTDAVVRDRVVVASISAILLDALWIALFPLVFFNAGGSR